MNHAMTTSDDLQDTLDQELRQRRDLMRLFGEETVECARQIDSADLVMTDQMTAAIADGLRRLRSLRADPDGQRRLIAGLEPGTRLLLCMWIMDMGLLQKIGVGTDPGVADTG